MPTSKSPKALALRICKAMHELKGSQLHWVSVRDLCKHMKLTHTDAFNDALEYGRKEELLSCSPPPIHSVMLTHNGEMVARGKMRKR
jgi:hypothetical protein